MANTIRFRRGSGAPSAGGFAEGEPGWDNTNGRLWVKATSAMVAVGGKYTVSGTAPSSPVNGDRWVDSDVGIEYTYIDDGNTSQWVETGAPGVIPTNITTSTADPTGGADGDIWIKYTA